MQDYYVEDIIKPDEEIIVVGEIIRTLIYSAILCLCLFILLSISIFYIPTESQAIVAIGSILYLLTFTGILVVGVNCLDKALKAIEWLKIIIEGKRKKPDIREIRNNKPN